MTAKIELTDKQIMRTELEAEKELSAQLTKEIEYMKKSFEAEQAFSSKLESQSYYMRQLLKAYL
jgi:hypothetical protein